VLGAFIAIGASLTATPPQPKTDFGVRVVGVPPAMARATEAALESIASNPSLSGRLSLSSAAALGAHWGRVTSTLRSVKHNRDVGGVPNSFHLSGRAVDIARRAGVNHRMIESAFVRAGYRLVETLDEGDHIHIAFSFGGSRPSSLRPNAPRDAAREATQWRIVYAPGSGR
jgi:hypothetical protein